jgi:hypothetical protein
MMIPTFALDFTSASLDPRVTLTRALNTATVTNADGSITIVNANLPRFDYFAGVCKGLMIEETRTNSTINSILNGAVVGAPGTPPTSWINGATTGSISAIENASYAAGFKLTVSCSATRRGMYQQIASVANTTYIFSATVEVMSGVGAPQYIELSQLMNVTLLPTGATISAYTLDGVSATTTSRVFVGTHTISLTITTAAATGSPAYAIGVGLQGNSTGVAKFSNIQIEQGSFATSYIPTTTTALTRNADVATITGTNFSDFWQAVKGGASVLATPSTVSGIRPLVQFDDNTANEIIALRGNTTNPELYIIQKTTPQAQLDAGTIAANTAYNLTGWWDTNDCKARQNSGATVSDYTATIPTVTQMRIGSDGTNYLNGTIATINYYDSFFGQPIYTRRKNKVFSSLL